MTLAYVQNFAAHFRLFPPTPRDPQGIHQTIWSEKYDGEFEFQPDKPLTLASYRATTEGSVARSFVEPLAAGDALPAMPLFLWSDRYINVDLEQTYQSEWRVNPGPLKLVAVERAGVRIAQTDAKRKLAEVSAPLLW